MKNIVTAFVFTLLISIYSTNTFANYSTPGTGVSWNLDNLVTNSGGVVTFSSGTYFINDTLIITSPDTIKILNNATVKLAQNVVFNTLGTIIINPPDSVKFTSIDTLAKFQEMRLDDFSDASIIRKFIFEYSFNGFRMLDSSPLIEQSTFRYNCNGNTTTSQAISLFRSNAILRNCQIYRNYRVGISGGANIANAPQILNCIFYENNILNGNVPHISLGQSGTGTTIIRGNTITGGNSIQTGGIATLPAGGTVNIIIENNIIKKNRYGIAIQGSGNAIIRGNIIDTNNIQNNPNLGGSGINLVGSGVTAIVSKNIIRGNLWGITMQTRSNLILGDLSSSDTNYVGLNQIYGNNNTGIFYDLYNNTNNPVKAENNYWGTTNLDTVEAHIVHQPDNDSGLVDYNPIWTLTNVQQVNTITPAQYKLFDAYPNPFNPTTNFKFAVPTAAFVKLTVYDILGREAALLVNGEMNAGTYNVDWNASAFASGIYFYSLTSGSFTETKRVVLVK